MSLSTGIFAVDGVDVAGLIAEHLGPRLLPAVLHKPGAKPTPDPDDPTDIPPPAPGPSYPCRGFTEDFEPDKIDGKLIKAGDRKVILLGGTLDVEPEGGVNKDQVTIENKRWNVAAVIDRDPAGATYTLQVRSP